MTNETYGSKEAERLDIPTWPATEMPDEKLRRECSYAILNFGSLVDRLDRKRRQALMPQGFDARKTRGALRVLYFVRLAASREKARSLDLSGLHLSPAETDLLRIQVHSRMPREYRSALVILLHKINQHLKDDGAQAAVEPWSHLVPRRRRQLKRRMGI